MTADITPSSFHPTLHPPFMAGQTEGRWLSKQKNVRIQTLSKSYPSTPASLHLTISLFGKREEKHAARGGWRDLMGLWAPILEGSINLIVLLKYITETHQAWLCTHTHSHAHKGPADQTKESGFFENDDVYSRQRLSD